MNLFELSSMASAVGGAIAGSITGARSGIVMGAAGFVAGGAIGAGTYFTFTLVAAITMSMSEKHSRLHEAAAGGVLASAVFSPFVAAALSVGIVYWLRQAIGT